MKLLIGATLVVAALMTQFSAADDNVFKAVKPPNDKLYPIYDAIATRMTEYDKISTSLLGVIYTEILQEYNEYLVTHNTQANQDYKTAIEKLLRSVELYEQHPENCNLKRAAQAAYTAAHTAESSENANRTLTYKVSNRKEYEEEYKNLINGFTAQFPDLIKNFITSLNESEQQQYADLYKLGKEFLQAYDSQEKSKIFQDFIVKIKFTENIVDGNEDNEYNCKWDVSKFEEFMEYIKDNVFTDMNSLDF